MINWTCPFCHTDATLGPQFANQEVTCSKCGQDSIVRKEKPVLSVATPRTGPTRPPVAPISREQAELAASDPSDTLFAVVAARVLIVLSLIAGIAIVASNDQTEQRLMGVLIILSVPFSWLSTIVAEEAYRARRLLERIAKK